MSPQTVPMVSKSPRIAVQAARDAFFEDPIFIEKGGWDRFAFDGDTKTAFKVRRYGRPFRYSVNPGVFRMDSVRPDVWLTACPIPFESKILELE